MADVEIPEIDLDGSVSKTRDSLASYYDALYRATKKHELDDDALADLAAKTEQDMANLASTPSISYTDGDNVVYEVPFGLDRSGEYRRDLIRRKQRQANVEAVTPSTLAKLFDELEAMFPKIDYLELSQRASSRFGLRVRMISQSDLNRVEKRNVRAAELSDLASTRCLFEDGTVKRVVRAAFDGVTFFILTE